MELSSKGEEIYANRILPRLATDKLKGRIVAIDVESEDYFIETTVLKAEDNHEN